MNSKRYDGVYYPVRDVEDLKEIVTSSCELFPEKTAYLEKDKELGEFVPIKYSQVKADLDALGTCMTDMGLQGKKVAVIGETSYRWILTYFTTVCGVGTIVPLDKNLPQEELLGLVERAGVSALFFADKSEKTIEPLFENPMTIEYFVGLDRPKDAGDDKVLSIEAMIDKGRELLEQGNKDYVQVDVDPDSMSTLLFTSGTTGLAKGVMLSHRNIAYNVQAMSKIFKIPEPCIVLSILPVHHAYEMTCDIWTSFYQGATIAICEGIRYIQKNMVETKANVMLGVPLVFEKMYKGMWKQAEGRGQAEKLRNAIDLSRRLRLFNNKAVMKRMFKAVHQSFGGNMQKFVAGGAAIDPKVIEDFEAMGFNMIQGYGMTEYAPIIAVNQDRYSKAAAAGKPMPGTEVRIVDQDEDGIGEVIVRGPSTMLGYYENREATDEVLINGWLHTGDLGYFDSDGFLYLTGRKKTVIVTKGGKNIFPEEVEAVFMEEPLIQEIVVHGVADEKVGNVMITADIFPNYDKLKEQKGEMSQSEVYHFFRELVDGINAQMPPYKQVKRVNIRKEEFPKTTTGKIKRYGFASGSTDDGIGKGGMSYHEVKEMEKRRAKEKARAIQSSEDSAIENRDITPVWDIRQMLTEAADRYQDAPALYKKTSSDMPFEQVSYKKVLADVNALGTAMMNKGLSGARVAVVGGNCYQWAAAYLAVICGVGTAVPLNKDLPAEELSRLISEAGCDAVIYSSALEKEIKEIKASGKTDLKTLICLSGGSDDVLGFDELIKEGQDQLATGDRQYLDCEIKADDLSEILFTKNGNSYAYSHASLADAVMAEASMVNITSEDVLLSVLPIDDIYERTAGLLLPLYRGASVAFCKFIENLDKNLKEIKPTVIVSDGGTVQDLCARVQAQAENSGRGRGFERLISAGKFIEKVGLGLPGAIVQDLRRVLGGRLRMLINRDPEMPEDVVDTLKTLGVSHIACYAPEGIAGICAVDSEKKKFSNEEAWGKLLPGIEIKVINKGQHGIGEICLKQGPVSLGRYSAGAVETGGVEPHSDGWLKTGDMGFVDRDRFVYVYQVRTEEDGEEE